MRMWSHHMIWYWLMWVNNNKIWHNFWHELSMSYVRYLYSWKQGAWPTWTASNYDISRHRCYITFNRRQKILSFDHPVSTFHNHRSGILRSFLFQPNSLIISALFPYYIPLSLINYYIPLLYPHLVCHLYPHLVCHLYPHLVCHLYTAHLLKQTSTWTTSFPGPLHRKW